MVEGIVIEGNKVTWSDCSMTDPDAELVEAMARAMATDWHGDCWNTTADTGDGRDGTLFRDDFRQLARAALRAYRERMVVL